MAVIVQVFLIMEIMCIGSELSVSMQVRKVSVGVVNLMESIALGRHCQPNDWSNVLSTSVDFY